MGRTGHHVRAKQPCHQQVGELLYWPAGVSRRIMIIGSLDKIVPWLVPRRVMPHVVVVEGIWMAPCTNGVGIVRYMKYCTVVVMKVL